MLLWRIARHSLAIAGIVLLGDLGVSHTLGQPVQRLLRDRWPVTLRVAGIGLLLGWLLATALAFAVSLSRLSAYEILGTTVSGAFLCIPAAVLALLSVIFNAPGYLAIALIVFPKIYRYSRNLLAKAYSLPHITAAGGHHREYCPRREHSGRVSVWTAWHRTTRLAGGAGTRSAAAGERHGSRYAGYLAGQFRGRCNHPHGEV